MFLPAKTQMLIPGVYAVRTGIVNFFLFAHDQGAIAFDVGMSAALASRGLEKLAIAPEQVTQIFLTHSDQDHTGGLGLFPQAQLYLSADEICLIDGSTPRGFGGHHNTLPRRSYLTLRDGEEIPAGGHMVRAIAAPGHTPGSMAYLLDGQILFTGDTIELKSGQLKNGPKIMSMDHRRQQESVDRLAGLAGISLICTAHSGFRAWANAKTS